MDCNGSNIPEDCETFTDCNSNGIPDECDVDPTDPDGDGLVSPDVNGNGIPDECENEPPVCDATAAAPGPLERRGRIRDSGMTDGCPWLVPASAEAQARRLVHMIADRSPEHKRQRERGR